MKTIDTEIFIVDLGILGVPVGQAIANDYKEVFYWTPWLSSFSKPFSLNIGQGIPGITRVDSYQDTKERIKKNKGIMYFPDCGMGDMQAEARREGIRVVGAGDSGELEMSRLKAKQVLKDRGLPMPKWDMAEGIDALEKLLRTEKDIYIKLDTENRGLLETFHHTDWLESRGTFYKLAYDLKCFRDTTKFIWEKPWPGVEIGQDKWIVQGKDFNESLYGIELKGDFYICRHLRADEFPIQVQRVNKAMEPVELKYKTSGPISSELRVNREGAYYDDFCRRQGNPPTACIVANTKNLGKVIEAIANGVEIPIEWDSKYAAEISVEGQGADKEEFPMHISGKDFDRFKIRAACRIGNIVYNIPFEEVGCTVIKAVGLGDTREEAEFECMASAAAFTEKCKGAFYNKGAAEEIEEEISKFKKNGLNPNDL